MKQVRFTRQFDDTKRSTKGGVHGMTSYPKGYEGEVADDVADRAIEAKAAEPLSVPKAPGGGAPQK